MVAYMPKSLLLLLLLQAARHPSALSAGELDGGGLVNISLVTREVAILHDKNFVIRCTVAGHLASLVDGLYFSWQGDVLRDNRKENRLQDLGNGTLVFKEVKPEYGMLKCSAKLLNGSILSAETIFMVHYPLCFVLGPEYVTTFSFARELKPGYETQLNCYGHCSCQFKQQWSIRIDDEPEELIELDKDREVRELTVSLLWQSKPTKYRLMFHESDGFRRGQLFLKMVSARSRVQVLCQLKAYTDPGMLQRYPVLSYTPHTTFGTFNVLLAPPPEVLTTVAPVVERCDKLDSLLTPGHVCWPHLQPLLGKNGTEAVADRLKNLTAVLPEAAAESAGVHSPHLPHCAALAQALLCSSTLCSSKPCRQHCLLVRDHVCLGEVKLLRLFPDCNRFPDADSEPACRTKFDLEAVMVRHSRPSRGALESDTDSEPRVCFSNKDFWRGLFYRPPAKDGVVATQPNCANWSSASNRLLSADYFKSLRGAGSQCRNPGSMYQRPSCIDKSDTRFHITCKVEDCEQGMFLGNSGLGVANPAATAIVASVVLLVALACVIVVLLIRKKHFGKTSGKEQGEEAVSLAQSHQLLPGDGAADMFIQRNVKFGQKTHLAKTYPKLERVAYSHDDFADLGKMIGKGAFFTVHLVETTKYKEARPDMPKLVALKVLDETADDQIVDSFLAEAELLLGMEHRYVMQVFGICASTRPFCLLVEYCEFGDLQTLLRNSASGRLGQPPAVPNGQAAGPSHDSATLASNVDAIELVTSTGSPGASAEASSSSGPRPLVLADLLRMGSQVANALSYISKRGLVFRDLASRNILVKSNYDIRLADFGMCRKLPLGNRAAYVVSESECLPVRWLAPETVRESRFYPESDVYAFGVLLWELFSMGEQPWAGHTVEQVWDLKLQDPPSQLARPERAPDNAWALMLACWAEDRANRPSFSALTYQLHQAATHC